MLPVEDFRANSRVMGQRKSRLYSTVVVLSGPGLMYHRTIAAWKGSVVMYTRGDHQLYISLFLIESFPGQLPRFYRCSLRTLRVQKEVSRVSSAFTSMGARSGHS